MDALRLDILADHIVAWHNSDRLARRITVAHVTSVGYVVLPFARAQTPGSITPAVAALDQPPNSVPADTRPPAAQALAPSSPGLAAPVAMAESDEPIEVLIDAPDLDLGAFEDPPASDQTIVEPRAPESADATARSTPDAPADIAVDKTLQPAADPAPADVPGTDSSADADLAEPPSAAEPAATPEPAAPPSEGPTLRERAMARAHQMALEAGSEHATVPAPAALEVDAAIAAAAAMPAHALEIAEAPEVPAAVVAAVASPAPASAYGEPAAPLLSLFSEDFIPPLQPAAVAEFALQHGASHASPGKNGLVRVVKPDADHIGAMVEQRWLLTAQIDIGGQRTRLLVGAGPNPSVLGQRLSGVPRLAMLAGPPLVVAAAAGVWWLWPAAPPPAIKPAPVAAAASTAATVAAASAAASAPLDVEPRLGRVDLPSLGPIVEERRRAAAAAAADAAASAAGATPAAGAQSPATVPPPAVVGPAFAVSTRLLRTRTESEQLAEAMRALLAGSGPPGLQVQALRSGDDWRVVVWPFTEQAQAEQARALLASRGMKVSVIDF